MNLNILIRTADGFLQAGKSLFSTYKNGAAYLTYYISPCTVNCSFACELYLKYLYYLENDKKLDKHYLKDIFNKLSKQAQNEIQTEYKKWNSLLSLEKCLKVHNRVFVDFRYFFEEDKDTEYIVEPQSLYNLMISLHNVCKVKEMEESENAH